MAHIITAVLGSGVLSLAWSIAQLGWIGGPISMLCIAIITYISSYLLSDCYRSTDPVTGTRNHSYMEAVRVNLKSKNTQHPTFCFSRLVFFRICLLNWFE